MNVPSKSNKYVCTACRFKIPQEDLEYIFVSQIGSLSFGGHQLDERWSLLSDTSKRMMVEHLCEEIVVARESISIRFACDPSLFKTVTFEQQPEPVNESPSHATVEVGGGSDQLAEPLLSEAEASKFLGISKMTLLRKRNAGLIGFFRVGFRVLYSKEKHLLPYLAKCEVEKSR